MLNKTRLEQHPTASPLLLPTGIELNVNIDEATLHRLLSLRPGESVGLGQPYSFAGSPPDLGQSYEISVASSAGDFVLAASVTRVVGDHEVEVIATRRGADVPSDFKLTLERLDFEMRRPWLWATILRLPILIAAPPEEDGPDEDDGDAEEPEDDDEFRDPDDVADAYEEMRRRHEDPWRGEEEEEGQRSPAMDDSLPEFLLNL